MAQQPHVLIIEDDPWQADIHTRRLQAAGYSVAVAHSPVQAMQAALQHTPQVIVADVLLSGNTILLLLNELQSDRALGLSPWCCARTKPSWCHLVAWRPTAWCRCLAKLPSTLVMWCGRLRGRRHEPRDAAASWCSA